MTSSVVPTGKEGREKIGWKEWQSVMPLSF